MNLKRCKLGLLVCALAASIFVPKTVAKADEEPVILEYYTSDTDNTITYYLSGLTSAPSNASVMYGSTVENIDDISTVGSSGRIYTLIIFDDSNSMTKRVDEAKYIVDNLLKNRLDGELFVISPFAEDLSQINYNETSFTNDYDALSGVLNQISCYNKDADMYTNVMYAITTLNKIKDASYKRIVIVSDGIHEDEQSVNGSRSEVYRALEATNYPIYTIGILTEKAEATDGQVQLTDDIRNLFELGRSTHGDTFYLTGKEEYDYSTITNSLRKDMNYVKITTSIVNQQCDGSKKNCRLILGDATLNVEVQMPVVEYIPPTETENETETETIETSTEDTETVSFPDPEPVPSGLSTLTIILIIVVVIALIVVIILLVLLKKKGAPVEDPEKEFMKLDNQIKNERYIPEPEKKGMKAGATPIMQKEPPAPSKSSMNGNYSSSMNNSMNNSMNSGMNSSMNNSMGAGFGNPMGNPNKTQILFDMASGGMGQGVPQVQSMQGSLHRISLQNADDPSKVYSGSFQDKVVVGRNPGSVQIVIPDNAISGTHCEIGVMGSKFYIKDLKSSNGSFVNGIKCTDPTEIITGCQIKLGRTVFIVKID